MHIGLSQDWPLSREEKTQRLLKLYDEDLEETNRLLQMSTRSGDLRDAVASKENIGDNDFNINTAMPNLIPGVIDCGSDAGSPAHGKEDAQSSQAASSTRSFDYMTPEPTPRTPPGYCSMMAPRTLQAQRPVSAPTAPSAPSGQPRNLSGKDFSVCQRTGTVIPSVPPMPPAALQPSSADMACMTPPLCQKACAVPATVVEPCSDIADRIAKAASPLRRRPQSAVAETAFQRYSRAHSASAHRPSRDSGQRRSEASSKEICYPPNVMSAARHGRYTEVESALLAGFVPNYADSYGNTAFHIACQNGQRRIAKLMVKYGCEMNRQNMKGNTGLHFLFAYGYPDIAEYFLKKGADEFIRNALGKGARAGIK